MRRTNIIWAIGLAVSLAGGTALRAVVDDSSETLKIFTPFVGHWWAGHYVGTDNSSILHEIKWEWILDGAAIREMKVVREAGFTMERTYYWDPVEAQIRFLTITNRSQVSSGTASMEDGKLLVQGVDDRQRSFRSSFQIMENGILEDRFFLADGDGWKQGHLIHYVAEQDGGGE